MNLETATRELSDPLLPAERLRAIAAEFPSLRARVAAHPALYPELRGWLGTLGDPDVDAALAARDSGAHIFPQETIPPPPASAPGSGSGSAAPPTGAPPVDAGPSSGGKGGRSWVLPSIAALLVAALVAGGAFWWFSRGADAGADEALGSERAVAAGKELARRLSGDDEAVTERQAVAGPTLFYYASSEGDVSQTQDGEPFIGNELIIGLNADPEDFDDQAALAVAEDVAADLGAHVVGVNAYQSSYQLLLSEVATEGELDALAVRALTHEGVVSASRNQLSEIDLDSSESLTGRDRDSEDGTEWAGKWGGQLGSTDAGNWGMQALGAPAIWDATEHAGWALEPVVVGIYDVFYGRRFDGETLHEALPPVPSENLFVPPILGPENHGEHVAGTIGAAPSAGAKLGPAGVRGVAPNVQLVLASPHTLWKASWLNNIRYKSRFSDEACFEFLSQKQPRVLNLSVGDHNGTGPDALDECPWTSTGECDADLAESLMQPGFRNTLVIKSAGNNACSQHEVEESVRGCEKAGAPNVADTNGGGALKARARGTSLEPRLLTVGSASRASTGFVGDDGAALDAGLEVSYFSSAGADVAAPGDQVLSTVNLSEDGSSAPNSYQLKSGTSMAAPHVTGLAAVLFGINPALEPAQVKQIIEATATTTPVLHWNKTGNGKEQDLDHGTPLVNGPGAVQVALLSKEEGSASAIAPGFVDILARLKMDGYRVSSDQRIPAELLGTWCPAENLRNGPDEERCLNLVGLFEAHPDAGLSARSGDVMRAADDTGRSTTRSTFRLCLDSDCTTGDGAYDLTYYPPGAVWECATENPSRSCPDAAGTRLRTNDHDVSYPRIVQTFTPASGPTEGQTVQSDPLYLDLAVPVRDWPAYSNPALEEDVTPSVMDLAQIVKGDFSSVEGDWQAQRHRDLKSGLGDRIHFGPGNAFTYYFGAEPRYGETVIGDGLGPASMGVWDPEAYYTGDRFDECSQLEPEVREVPGTVAIRWTCTDPSTVAKTKYFYLAFYEPGVRANWPEALFNTNPDAAEYYATPPPEENVPQDLELPRITAGTAGDFGRGKYATLNENLFYRVDAAAEDVDQGQAANATCVAPVADAYPCAGGPVPSDARTLTARTDPVSGSSFVGVQTPSGNITCDVRDTSSIGDAQVTCAVGGWKPEMNPDYDENSGGYVTANLSTSGPSRLGGKGDPMISKNSGAFIGDVLPYGTVWHYGDFVFASEEAGLTFWNAATGYGALINKSGFYPFGTR